MTKLNNNEEKRLQNIEKAILNIAESAHGGIDRDWIKKSIVISPTPDSAEKKRCSKCNNYVVPGSICPLPLMAVDGQHEFLDPTDSWEDEWVKKYYEIGGLTVGQSNKILAFISEVRQKAKEEVWNQVNKERSKDIMTVGWQKGEMDFGINCSIGDLTYEQMKAFRNMTCVAIGQAENMWRRARDSDPQVQAASSLGIELEK